MNDIITPLNFLITVAGWWVNEWQAKRIEFLCEQIKVYQRIAGTGRLPMTNEERSRLAVLGKAIGLEALRALPTLVQPETFLAWHRRLIARKYDGSTKRGPGRPRIMADIRALIVQMAVSNPLWGYTRIRGALRNIGHIVGRGTITNVLKEHGIVPAPERSKRTRWSEFLRAHWDVLAATDFFTVEVWTPRGLVTYYVLFVIEVSTRRVEIAGITRNPNAAFMAQVARLLRNLEDALDCRVVYSSFMRALMRIALNNRDSVIAAAEGQLQSALMEHWERSVLRHEESFVHSARFSPGGNKILTRSESEVVLWDHEGNRLATLDCGRNAGYLAAMFSPDGQRVLTPLRTDTLVGARLWNADDTGVIRDLEHDTDVVTAAFSPGGEFLVTGAANGLIKVWSSEGILIGEYAAHAEAITDARFSPDGKRLLTASLDKTAKLWRIRGHQLYPDKTLVGHTGSIVAAEFSPNGTLILTTSGLDGTRLGWGSDGTARVWGLDGQQRLELPHDELWTAQFSPDADSVITAGGTTVRRWSMVGKSVEILKVRNSAFRFAHYLSDGRHIVAGVRDGRLLVLDVEQDSLRTLVGQSQWPSFGDRADTGKQFLTFGFDHTARLWDLSNPYVLQDGAAEVCVDAVTSTPDGRRLVTTAQKRGLELWNEGGERLARVTHNLSLKYLTCAPDGTAVAACGWTRDKTGVVAVWKITSAGLTENPVAKVETGDVIHRVAFSPDGKSILIPSAYEDTVWEYHIATGEKVKLLDHEYAYAAAFSPDKDLVVSAGWGDLRARLHFLDQKLGASIELPHSDRFTFVTFAPDGRRVLTASMDGSVRQWSRAGDLIGSLKGHKHCVWTARYSADGSMIVSASADGNARVWSTEGELHMILRGTTSQLTEAVFSGERVVTRADDGTVRLWTIDADKLILKAQRRMSRVQPQDDDLEPYAELLR